MGKPMPVVRRIVEEHGGQVTFESDEGAGSRFVVLLPVDPSKRETLQAMIRVASAPEEIAPEIKKPKRPALERKVD